MRRAAKIAAGIAAAAVIGAGGTALFVYSGAYDISATDQHTPPVYWLMEFMMKRAVAVRSRESDVPANLAQADVVERGLGHYERQCAQCHGAPGVPPQPAALGMTPVPAYLVPIGRDWPASHIRWVVKYGIKMTGMPAWKYRMSDDEIWEVVAFVKHRLPYLSPAQYREAVAKLPAPAAAEARSPGPESGIGDAAAGRRAIDQYACATCHVIPGITGAAQHVGPPLKGIASRSYIGGVLANTPRNMVRWLMSPQSVSPGSAMPDLGVREQDARDITAFLATLKSE
jgi:mono/diheme cytochrome c family protein